MKLFSATTRFFLCFAMLGLGLQAQTATADLFMVQQGSPTNDILWRYDIGLGSITNVGNIGFGDVRGLAYDATSDTLYGISRSEGMSNSLRTPRLLEINRGTGAGSLVSSNLYLPTGSNTAEISVDAAGNLVGLGLLGSWAGIDTILDVNKTSGIASVINTGGVTGTSVGGLAFEHDSGTLYASSFFGQLSTIDPITGLQTLLGSMTGGSNIGRIVYEQDLNIMFGVNNTNGLFTIDLGTLAATNIENFTMGSQLYSIASAPRSAVVPEPGSIGLFGAAIMCLYRRRRKV